MDHELEGGELVRLSDMVQAVLGAVCVYDGSFAAAGLGQVY